MNLNGIVAGIVGAVNAQQRIIVRVSDGYETGANGRQIPKYLPPVYVLGQIQSLTFRDLQQTEGLNLQGEQRAIYVNGRVDGLIRPDGKGGDLIIFPDGSEWLTTLVLEHWLDWTKVAATLQRRKSLAPASGV